MSDLNSELISTSEQMYLITIARAIEDGEPQPIPLSHIAHKLSLQPVSVNQMVRKLESQGWLHYLPYKGVELTATGIIIANRTLRNRRLWEVFLVDHLNVSPQDADVMACDLEHVTPDDIAHRLSNYLGDPAVGPGGQRIPGFNENQIIQDKISLKNLEVGMTAQILKVDGPPVVVRFLSDEGLRSGIEITLDAIGSHESRLVTAEKGFVEITADIAERILLLPPNKLKDQE
jgi:DtxR family Mn-dependent transcriptional regulator